MDDFYMAKALDLAELGIGHTGANPAVGCVIVKEGEIIGKGYHKEYGGPHGEINALKDCIKPPKGATLYVNLEPCCHYGKTPPCTEAIIKSGLKRVVIGVLDPNPMVCGQGAKILKKAGLDVISGVLEARARDINQAYFHYIKNKTPFAALKYAMTLDGKTATESGKSRWITGEAAREHVHGLRHKYSGIMVGINTVIQDDPILNCRLKGGKNPLRIICDSRLRLPLKSKIVKTAEEIPTYIAYCLGDKEKEKALLNSGLKLLKMPAYNNRVNLKELMVYLGKEGLSSILLEGGPELNYSALEAGIIQKAYIYIAPKMFGGKRAKTGMGGIGIDNPDSAFLFEERKISLLGEDILLEYKVR